MPALRYVALLGGEDAASKDLSSKLSDQLVALDKEHVVASQGERACRRFLAEGKFVVHTSAIPGRAARFARMDGGMDAWLVKVGGDAVQVDSKIVADFAKTLTVANEADIAGVVAQVKDQVTGKQFTPFAKLFKVTGDLSNPDPGLNEEDVKKAFAVFGPVQYVRLTKVSVTAAFTTVEGSNAALEKKEITLGGTTVKLMSSREREKQTKAPRPESVKKTPVERSWFYLKVEGEIPEGVELATVKEAAQKVGGLIADFNRSRRTSIWKFTTADEAGKAAKAGVTLGGVQLKLVEYVPRGGKGKKAGADSKPTGERKPEFAVKVDGADPSKCTEEDIRMTFGALKGLVRISRAKRSTAVYVVYDNAESQKEVLSAKGITCGSAQVTVSPDGRPGRAAKSAQAPGEKPKEATFDRGNFPRRAREQTVVIPDWPRDGPLKQLKAELQKIDAHVHILGAGSGNLLYVAFSTVDLQKAAVGKTLKIGKVSVTLKARDDVPKAEGSGAKSEPKEARAPREPRERRVRSEFGFFIKDGNKSQKAKLSEAIKAAGAEGAELVFRPSGCIVRVKTESEAQAVLKGGLSVDGAPVVVEPLRKNEKPAN